MTRSRPVDEFEGVVGRRRRVTDRLATVVMTFAFAIVLFPLLSVAWTVVEAGLERFDPAFFARNMELTL
ncbi:MAG TPA: hypothetical protein VKZ47_07555, partial [Acidimicrobiia bacterium]|nr:hypothetical protein [Acidimicrobiia bacterium]